MPLLATKVASICPHSTYSQMFLSTFHAHREVGTTTLVSSIVPLLRVVPLLLSLAREIPLSLVPSKLLGTLGRVIVLALWK